MSSTDSHEARLASSSIELPAPLPAFGQYVPTVLARDVLWVGGHFGTRPDGTLHTGRCGDDLTAETARDAARSAAINMLATIRDALGSLDRVEQVVRVYGVVNATAEFEVFGDAGRHARLAVGVSSLPANLVLEIEAQILVKAD